MYLIFFLLALTAAYLIGSIPTSFIMAKLIKGVDIREHGSGNVGATNVLRVVGKVPALIALIIDMLKGAIVVLVLAGYTYKFVAELDYDLYRAALGLAAIVGHIWPAYLNFRGGKGVATTIGVVATLAPKIFFPSLLVWIVIFALTKYVSVASISFGVALPIFSALLNGSIYITIFAVILCFINSYKHKSNIKRLIRSEEPKTKIFGKKR